MKWLDRMLKRHDPDKEDMSKEISEISDRGVRASKRLDHLALLEREARLRSLSLQAEVLSRSDRRRVQRRSKA